MDCDVAVVGCGPVGAFCAKTLADKGFRVIVFEEHKDIGLPKHCSGLIHPRIEDIADMSFEEAVENEIRGAHIFHGDDAIALHADSCKSLVLDRSAVDRMLAESAEAAGADVRRGEGARTFERLADGISVNDVKCRILLGADGMRGRVAGSFGLSERGEIIRGLQCNARFMARDRDSVQVYFGRDVAPGFFAWVIPTSEEECRIGLGVNSGSASAYLKKLLQRLGAEPYETFGGGIPIGLRRKSYCERVMLVGDAAMQVKPISGGGVNIGLRCAEICADVAARALENDETDERSLSVYQDLWKKEFGREIRFGMTARKFIYSLDDEKISRILNAPDEELLKKMAMYGDIDHPSRIVEPLAASVALEPGRYAHSRYLALANLVPDALRALLG